MTPSTPKTWLYLAKETQGGVVLYRKSHLTTYVLKLTMKDRLVKGSRFYGRLFPGECSISPDGKLFSYVAMGGQKTDGKWQTKTWAAVCTPPRLAAHVFAPKSSSLGMGALFLSGGRLAVLDSKAELRDPNAIRPYTMIAGVERLSVDERERFKSLVRPPAETELTSPLADREHGLPILWRSRRKRGTGYSMFGYRLCWPDGSHIEGADDIMRCDWAGWDCAGRLLIASGRFITIFVVSPRKPLGKPMLTLDIEDAIAV